LRQSSTKLRDSIRRQFLRTLFHDLATPLSAVSLHLEGANRRLARGEDPAASLDIARSELGRAFDLFDRARELLLSEPREAESFGLDDWVETTLSRFPADEIAVHGTTGGRIAGDRERLCEALSALVGNALEHGSSPPVAVFRERVGDRLLVRVENRGLLPGQDVEKLFAPRTAAAGKNWGMGLALARLYAADSGGDILLSQKGESVVAILTFPEEPA
jgi:signal transduction histidine kinase